MMLVSLGTNKVLTCKATFYARENFMQIRQNGPVDNLCNFYLCILMFCVL